MPVPFPRRPTYREVVLSTQPFLYFPLDSIGTAKPTDAVRARAGTWTTVAYGSPLLPGLGPSVTFNGTSSSVDVTDVGLPAVATARSISAIIATTSAAADADIVGYGTTTTNQDLWISSNNGVLTYSTHAATAGLGGVSLKDGLPHHVLVTFDGTTLAGYIDGVRGTDRTPSLSTTLAQIHIGLWSNYFNGRISDVAFWDRALSQTEALYLNAVLRGA